jgi:hypothetical protein
MGGGTVGNTANNLVSTLKTVTDKSAKKHARVFVP